MSYSIENPKEVAFYALPGALDMLGVSVTVTELNKLLKKGLPIVREKSLSGGKTVRYFKPEECAAWIKEFYPTARVRTVEIRHTHEENSTPIKKAPVISNNAQEVKPAPQTPKQIALDEWKPLPRQLAVYQTEDVSLERKLQIGDHVEVCKWNGRLLYTPEALLGKRGKVVSAEDDMGFVKVQLDGNSEARNISVCNLKVITTKDCTCEYKLKQDDDGSVLIVIRHNKQQAGLAKFRPVPDLGISAEDILALAETVVTDLL